MPGRSRGRLAVAFSLTDGPFEPILWSFYSAQPSLQHSRHKGMLQWVGSEGNVRAPKFILYCNTELGEEEGSIVQEIIVCVLTITPLNVTYFQSLGNTLSFREEKVICHVI